MKKILIILSLLLFYSCSEEKINEVKTENTSEKPVILALWDSLTVGYWLEKEDSYPAQLEKKIQEKWYNYEIIFAWVSWETSVQIQERAWLYLEKKPEIVILVAWWNDWLQWLRAEEIKKNLLEIIHTFKDSKVVLWGMDVPLNLWWEYREKFKNVYLEIAKEEKNIYFLEFFLEWVAGKKELNLEDKIHPNRAWYKIIVDNLYKFLEKNNLLHK